MEVNPEVVINDLLDQIRRLTLENSLLRSAISEYQQPLPAVEDTDED
jgi:hypothetical protein